MSITAERYTAAMHSSDLSDEAHKIGQVDLIKASGMSKASVASHYLRIITKPSRSDIDRMHAELVYEFKVKKVASPHDSAAEAIRMQNAYFRNHAEHMDYAANAELGVPIGSGSI